MRFLPAFVFGATSLLGVDQDQARLAQRELFAAHFDIAVELYSAIVKSDPSWAPAYYGLVRASLGARRPSEAYAAAEAAQKAAPGTPDTETAVGMAAYRRGEIAESQQHFRRALSLNPQFAGALMGLARDMAAISKFKTARDLYQAAYRAAPEDPVCILEGLANQVDGAEQIAALERVLAIYDPATRESRNLQGRIASDRAVGNRKLRQIASPYQHYSVKLLNLIRERSKTSAAGIMVEIDRKKFNLLLDTGASGISISPKAAKRAGIEGLAEEPGEARGIGDRSPTTEYRLLAGEVRVGDLTFTNVPMKAFSTASIDADGLIGTDVFRRFLVTIDFPHRQMFLDPFEQLPPDLPIDAADTLDPGFARAFRIGHLLTVPTSVNGSVGRLFLVDSGASRNQIDVGFARETSQVYSDDRMKVKGLQGEVGKVFRVRTATLVFAGFRYDASDMSAFDMTKSGDDLGVRLSGLLGMEVLDQLRVTINYREGSVRFRTH